MHYKSIVQTIWFEASAEVVYHMLMDAGTHAAFTNSKATISKELDGKFSVYDGYCHGYNIELKEGEKIVQAWHFAEEGWPDDHFSICTFIFEHLGTKTKLTFTQTGIPEHKAEALESGWREYYWEPMQEYLKKSLLTSKD
ncbi:MAG: SRPBCC domain-containing protein [Saprospiraceae bacterium]|nr:SRPBCC domain-containing protein [Saprospiraceae bacterium]